MSSVSQRSAWDDPEIQRIASAFFVGYERGQHEWEESVEAFDIEILRSIVADFLPRSAAVFEAMTKEQMLDLTPMMATALGVAFAIRGTHSSA